MKAGRRRVRISNPAKVLFPADGITKADLAAYYAEIAPAMVPHVRDRPLNLWRWNAGIDKPGRRAAGDPQGRAGLGAARRGPARARAAPSRTRSAARARRSSGSPTRTASRRTPGPTAPTGSACPTGSCSTSTRPTRTPRATSPRSAPARSSSASLLRELGLEPFAMTSGSRGIHVVAPLRRRAHADEVRATAGELAEPLAERRPDELTTFWRKEKRGGRVLVDVARNTYGADDRRALRGAGAARRAGGRRRWRGRSSTTPSCIRGAGRSPPCPAGSTSAATRGRASPAPRAAPAPLDPGQPLGQLAQRRGGRPCRAPGRRAAPRASRRSRGR